MVIVDSDVWSEVFRSKSKEPSRYAYILNELIEGEEVVMIGPIRQEVLSGIRSKAQFESIRHALRSFPDVSLHEEIHELAASFYNLCRSKGIQGSHTDFLICAVSVQFGIKILSKDKDYIQYSKYIPIDILSR